MVELVLAGKCCRIPSGVVDGDPALEFVPLGHLHPPPRNTDPESEKPLTVREILSQPESVL